MASTLSPVTRRIVGLMLIVCGGLLVVAQGLRLIAVTLRWQAEGWASVSWYEQFLTLLMLLLAVLCIRYGLRIRKDGRISDEPGKGRIS